jgi:excisionase family DNA binding protein
MDELFTPAELATKLKLSEKTINRLIDSGKLPAIRFGNRKRVSQEGLDEYKEKYGVEPLVKPNEPKRRGREDRNLEYRYLKPS